MQQPSQSLKKVGHYLLGTTIGRGSFGKVKEAVHEFTGIKVAVKIINKSKMRSRRMVSKTKRQIRFLKYLNHPNIVKLYQVLDNNSYIFVVMELATKGQLYDLIQGKGNLNQTQAKHFFRQILAGVTYCHQHLVAHRDLKPQNILVDENDILKIGDFGLSNIMKDGKFLKTSCGSPHYASPQITSGRPYQGSLVDVWSCGVILYLLLTGQLPFDDQNRFQLFKKIESGVFEVPSYLSAQAIDLLKSTIRIDPCKRLTLEQMRLHPWIRQTIPLYASIISYAQIQHRKQCQLDKQIIESVMNYGLDAGGRSFQALGKSIRNRQQDSFIVTYQLLNDEKNKTKQVQQTIVKKQFFGQIQNKLKQNPLEQKIENIWGFGYIFPVTAKTLIKRVIAVLSRMKIIYQIKSAQYRLKCNHLIEKKSPDIQMQQQFQDQDDLAETLLEEARSEKMEVPKHSTNQISFYIQLYEIESKKHVLDFQLSRGHAIFFLSLVGSILEQVKKQLQFMSVIIA